MRELIPTIWADRKIDYVIHIGMASGRQFYSVERRGHRDGYTMKDVDQKFLNDGERRKQQGDNWVWAGLPEELLSSVAIDDVWRRWRCALPVSTSEYSQKFVANISRILISEYLRMLADTSATSYISRVSRT